MGPQWGAMNFMQNSVMQVGMFSQLLQNSSQVYSLPYILYLCKDSNVTIYIHIQIY